jgi:protein TonB
MGIFYPTGPATGSRYSYAGSATGSSISFLSVAAMHGVVLALLLFFVPAGQVVKFIQPLAVRLIELAPEAPPPPAPTKVQPQPKPPPMQPRILAIAPAPNAPEAPTAFVVPAPPPEPAVPPAPTFVASHPAHPAPITAARFDAAYLQNPRPVYPAISRRLGEEGKVVLRVHVDASGLATEVTIKTSSAFPRLDNAAREVVQQWRFVPARRGDEPTEAWVLVPIVFKLEG